MTPRIISDFIADPARTLQSIRDGLYPKPPRPTMPPFDRVRRDFMQLMPRHLDQVEERAVEDYYDREILGEYFLLNWNRMFGTLRKSKAKEVPSDTFRKQLMIHRLLDLIELRREEIAANVLPGGLN